MEGEEILGRLERGEIIIRIYSIWEKKFSIKEKIFVFIDDITNKKWSLSKTISKCPTYSSHKWMFPRLKFQQKEEKLVYS